MIGWSPVLASNGGNTMVRKVIIALAAVTFAGAMAAPTPADARMGGGFRGGGVHRVGVGGGFSGGGVFVGGARGGRPGGGGRRGGCRGRLLGGGGGGRVSRGRLPAW